MIERIKINEERLDNVSNYLEELEKFVKKYPDIKKQLKDLNKYYGSKNWFHDLDEYEKGKSSKFKAGVLSEDGIWNTIEKWKEMICILEELITKEKTNGL